MRKEGGNDFYRDYYLQCIWICEKASLFPTFSIEPVIILEIESNQPYIDLKILHTLNLKKAFQRCEELFLLNDFMPLVMTWKQFSSSLQPTCDWYRNNVRNAEAFMKSRLLFLEMIAQKSLKKLRLKQKALKSSFANIWNFVLICLFNPYPDNVTGIDKSMASE